MQWTECVSVSKQILLWLWLVLQCQNRQSKHKVLNRFDIYRTWLQTLHWSCYQSQYYNKEGCHVSLDTHNTAK